MLIRWRKPLVFVLVSCIGLCAFTILVFQYIYQITPTETLKLQPRVNLRVGLKAEGKHFTLDDKPFTILSGAIHYFRIVPEYWEDRLLKLKAIGLNTVETYVPWNVHEPSPGKFNFGGMADIRNYIKLAHKLGLHVIVRPGPYICAEWEYGGLPSWLLRDRDLVIRSMSSPYLEAVDRYLRNLLPLLIPLQYQNGGPIIAFQVENEYGNYGNSSDYMQHLHNVFISNGVSELMFTSDGLTGIRKKLLPSVLQTINFQHNPDKQLKQLKMLQPDKPLMVMEFWPGWFDHWSEKHQVMDPDKTVKTVRTILNHGSSINFYMFHGGTNFGFMNGGNQDDVYQPTITSYDYDCPISEAGDITPKYIKLHELFKELKPTDTIPDKLVLPPALEKVSYGNVKMTKFLSLERMALLLEQEVSSEDIMSMEDLPINNGAGQSYGYTLYRTTISVSAKELVIENLRDYGQVFIDREVKDIVRWPNKKAIINIDLPAKASKTRILEILVENCGRVNYGKHILDQRKGIIGKVKVDSLSQKQWKIFPFDFSDVFVKKLLEGSNLWTSIPRSVASPALFKGSFSIEGKPKDTFLDMKGWVKGVAFVNGHNLGRYWSVGPQETLYVPAPWLNKGQNTVIVFEQHPGASRFVRLVKEHRLGPAVEHT